MRKTKQNDSKKILVAFYSRSGHTEKAANIIAKYFNVEMDKIEDKKSRKGIIGFLKAGYDATFEKTTNINYSKNPADYDIVILGGPIWNGRITPAVRTYLLKNRDNIKKAVFFATYAGGEGKCLKQISEIYNGEILAKKVILRKKIDKEIQQLIEELKLKI